MLGHGECHFCGHLLGFQRNNRFESEMPPKQYQEPQFQVQRVWFVPSSEWMFNPAPLPSKVHSVPWIILVPSPSLLNMAPETFAFCSPGYAIRSQGTCRNGRFGSTTRREESFPCGCLKISQTRPCLGLPVRTAEKRPGVVPEGVNVGQLPQADVNQYAR